MPLKFVFSFKRLIVAALDQSINQGNNGQLRTLHIQKDSKLRVVKGVLQSVVNLNVDGTNVIQSIRILACTHHKCIKIQGSEIIPSGSVQPQQVKVEHTAPIISYKINSTSS